MLFAWLGRVALVPLLLMSVTLGLLVGCDGSRLASSLERDADTTATTDATLDVSEVDVGAEVVDVGDVSETAIEVVEGDADGDLDTSDTAEVDDDIAAEVDDDTADSGPDVDDDTAAEVDDDTADSGPDVDDDTAAEVDDDTADSGPDVDDDTAAEVDDTTAEVDDDVALDDTVAEDDTADTTPGDTDDTIADDTGPDDTTPDDTTPDDTTVDAVDATDATGDSSVMSECGLVTTSNDALYADLEGLSGDALRAELHDRIDEHVGLSYDNARNLMYVTAKIDVDADGFIRCIYTGEAFEADGTRSPGDITTEHSWPRSDGAADFPAEGDIHHLFPATSVSNGRRGNDEFGEVSCEETTPITCPWGEGDSYSGPAEDGRSRVFEVRQAYRGDVARAHFYFAVRYGLPIPPLEEETLRMWHCDDPVDDAERARNDAIFIWQLNRNPFVDQPQLVERVFDY